MATIQLLTANYEQNGAGYWDSSEGYDPDNALMCGPLIQGKYVSEIRFKYDKKTYVKSITITTTLKGDSWPYNTSWFFSTQRYMPYQVLDANKTVISGKPPVENRWYYNNDTISWTITLNQILNENQTYYLYLYPTATSGASIDGKYYSVSLTSVTVDEYTVEYKKNESTSFPVTGTTSNSTHTYSVAKNLTANGYSREGFTFAGWNTKADGSGTSH